MISGTDITLSIQARISNSVEALGLSVPVYFGRWPDPDSMMSPSALPVRRYVVVQWMEELSGSGGWHVAQIDVITHIGGQMDPDGDPGGVVVRRIADAICAGFAPPSNHEFDAHTWADPLAPQPAGTCIRVYNSRGAQGAPESKRVVPWGPEDELNRLIMRWRFTTVGDIVWRNGHHPR